MASDFLKDRLAAANNAAKGDAEECRRILDHAVAEDPDAIRRIGEDLRRPK